MTDTTPLTEALRLLALGFSVIPVHTPWRDGCSCGDDTCASPGKHPRIRWTEYQKRLPTEDEVRRWFKRWSQANIGIATGAVSGIVVVDIDPRHGGDESARDLSLPDTVICLTGGGGTHLYYKHPGFPIPPGAALMPGIDLRGDGGFVVCPPSHHVSGGSCQWEIGSGPGERPYEDWPARMEALRQNPALAAPQNAQGKTNGTGGNGRGIDPEDIIRRGIAIGERNDVLTKVAGHFAASASDEAEVLRNTLYINAEACAEPLGYSELRKIVESIWTREAARRSRAEQAHHVEEADVSVMSDAERGDLARAVWKERLGIICSDWYVMRGIGREYFLETPEHQISLGDDMLDFRRVKQVIANDLHLLIAPMKTHVWEPIALALIRLSREVVVESNRASERAQEWLEDYCSTARDMPINKRRDTLYNAPIVYKTQGGATRYAFRLAHFRQWVEQRYGERFKSRSEFTALLRQAGLESSEVIQVTDEGAKMKVWLWTP